MVKSQRNLHLYFSVMLVEICHFLSRFTSIKPVERAYRRAIVSLAKRDHLDRAAVYSVGYLKVWPQSSAIQRIVLRSQQQSFVPDQVAMLCTIWRSGDFRLMGHDEIIDFYGLSIRHGMTKDGLFEQLAVTDNKGQSVWRMIVIMRREITACEELFDWLNRLLPHVRNSPLQAAEIYRLASLRFRNEPDSSRRTEKLNELAEMVAESGQLFAMALVKEIDGDPDEARSLLLQYQADTELAPPQLRLAARLLHEYGRWTDDLAIFEQAAEALSPADPIGKLSLSIMRFCAERSRDDAPVTDAPKEVANYLAATHPPNWKAPVDNRLLFVGGSLAGGGAEKIMAKSFAKISQTETFAGTRLAVMELGQDTGKSAQLPLLKQVADRVMQIEPISEPSWPFDLLPRTLGIRTQRISAMIQEYRPVVLHCWLDQVNLAGGLAGLYCSVPRIILHCHNMRPSQLWDNQFVFETWRAIYRTILARSGTHLVNCSQAGLEDYLDWLGLAQGPQFQVIHNGMNFAPLAPSKLEKPEDSTDAPVRIGTAHGFTPVKQPLLWLDAARIIRQSNPAAEFVMFGDGPLLTASIAHAEKIGLADQVQFPGRIENVETEMAKLDLFMLSSSTESLPNVLIEAQSVGVPVVAFDVGGVGETLLPDISGKLATGKDAQDLANAACVVLKDADWMARAGAAGPAFVREKFSLERMTNELSMLLSTSTEN
jgi:glycosyltransferase involved in cell wall biosynthesis